MVLDDEPEQSRGPISDTVKMKSNVISISEREMAKVPYPTQCLLLKN